MAERKAINGSKKAIKHGLGSFCRPGHYKVAP
jgi:hypothetical protein